MTQTSHETRHEPLRACIGNIYASKSGRQWKVVRVWRSQRDRNSFATVVPLGPDTYGYGGGVKSRSVDLARLDLQTHGWKWLHGGEGR